jgi:hypothetical protein
MVPFLIQRENLDLLSAPTSVRLAHVRRRLNGRDELEGRVGDADEADDGAADDLPYVAGFEDDDADENVDFWCATGSESAQPQQKDGNVFIES